jgi:hypothetical protein
MTPQEQLLLDDFLQRLAAVNGVNKDAQADALIRQRLANQPDAVYLLVQRCLLQQHALDAAKAQIAQLQAQLAGQQQGGGSFLGSQPQSAWGTNPPPFPPQQQAPAPAPTWRERLFGSGAPAAPQQGGGSSFFANAATTAAGVAGGMFLFDGIESLLGGHRGGGFFGGGFGGQPEVIENITENNFYDNGSNNLPSGGDQDFASDDFDDANFDSSSFDDDNSWT